MLEKLEEEAEHGIAKAELEELRNTAMDRIDTYKRRFQLFHLLILKKRRRISCFIISYFRRVQWFCGKFWWCLCRDELEIEVDVKELDHRKYLWRVAEESQFWLLMSLPIMEHA